jgi:KTSC domain
MEEKKQLEILLEPVISSNIKAIGFNGVSKMRVQFTNGAIYDTEGAQQADFDNFKSAKSPGKHFNSVLKKAFIWTKITKKGD